MLNNSQKYKILHQLINLQVPCQLIGLTSISKMIDDILHLLNKCICKNDNYFPERTELTADIARSVISLTIPLFCGMNLRYSKFLNAGFYLRPKI